MLRGISAVAASAVAAAGAGVRSVIAFRLQSVTELRGGGDEGAGSNGSCLEYIGAQRAATLAWLRCHRRVSKRAVS